MAGLLSHLASMLYSGYYGMDDLVTLGTAGQAGFRGVCVCVCVRTLGVMVGGWPEVVN